jgi:DNA polymerase-3 subunit gamma/tau
MKALYRRYRPKTLSEVVGQEQVTSVLQKAIANKKIAHAYLFIGPRGTGKTSVARILAHEINGFKYELEDDYIDIIEIDAASNTGVDNIRDLREKAIIAPTKGKYKVYIIDEVHMLSKSAFNALLKTLEEPPEHVIFIMATTDAYKVPVTITSRSQVYTFRLADPSVMFDFLKKVCKEEKIKITDDALKIVVRRGGGSFRDSLSLLDQVSTLSDDEIDEQLITKALGLPQQEAIISILNGYAAGDANRIREQLQTLLDSGIKAEVIADNLISEIVANPQPIHIGLLEKLIDVSRSAYPSVKLLIALSGPAQTPAFPVAAAPRPRTVMASAPISAPKPAPAPKAVEPKAKPAEEVQAEKASEPTAEPINMDQDAAEIWNQILLHVEQNAFGIYPTLQKANYTIEGNKIIIFEDNGMFRKKIEAKVPIISEILPDGYTIEVKKGAIQKDPELAAVADIFGGGEELRGEEVQIDA